MGKENECVEGESGFGGPGPTGSAAPERVELHVGRLAGDGHPVGGLACAARATFYIYL